MFFEDDAIAAFVVLDHAQKGPHQHDAAAAGFFEVFVLGGVGHVLQAETGALVFDHDADFVVGDLAGDKDLFARVEAVAVLDGVDQGLFEGQADAEDPAGVESRSPPGAR